MLIAVPVSEGKLFPHFGHCAQFALIAADDEKKTITGRTDVDAPPHEPGLLPPWLAKQGVTHVIAGGLGGRAMQLMTENGIVCVVGAPQESPETLVRAYLTGALASGANGCDH